MSHCRWKYSALLAILIILATNWTTANADSCESDSDCLGVWGNHSECESESCRCHDYYHLGTQECVMQVPVNRTCFEHAQCRGGLGDFSICNATSHVCECSTPGQETRFYNGKCVRLKTFGESCLSHNECILGTESDLARCESTCKCYSDDEGVRLIQKGGRCTVEECGSGTSLSVFAACIAVSVGLLLLIAVIYRVTNSALKRNVGMRNASSNSSMCPIVADEEKNGPSTSSTNALA